MGVTSGFYSANDHVETLTPANFDSKVINDDAVWIVEFYAPWFVMNLIFSLKFYSLKFSLSK